MEDIATFAVKISNFFLRTQIHLPSQFSVCRPNNHKSRKLSQGKFAVGQGNREFEKHAI